MELLENFRGIWSVWEVSYFSNYTEEHFCATQFRKPLRQDSGKGGVQVEGKSLEVFV